MVIIDRTSHGVTYYRYPIKQDVEGALCEGETNRTVLTGPFEVTTIEGSWKFKKQLQLRIRTPKGQGIRFETRNKGSSDTFEIYLPIDYIDLFLEKLKEAKIDYEKRNSTAV